MGFVDGLTDIATINTITYNEDAYGKESKVITPLYTNIKCRLGKGSNKLVFGPDREERMIVTYKLYVLPENGTANRSDQVIINGNTYIIFGGQPAKGGDTNHYIYNIREDE